MKYSIACFLFLLSLCVAASGQSRFGRSPSSPAGENPPPTHSGFSPSSPSRNELAMASKTGAPAQLQKINSLDLQAEAKTLLELSQSIQADAAALNQGMLPRDMPEKLKQIQKTAKHMRNRISF